MTKRLVVLSDGTGNSAGKAEKTNVWRTFQAVDQSLGVQLVMYDDGVGTSSNKYLAALGGAFGWGLKRNVIDLYMFICRNYNEGDELFGFGFSRGAFTIRTLVDFIVREGLVDYDSEEELYRNSRRAYASYRKSCFRPTLPLISPVSLFRWLGRGITALVDKLSGRGPLAKRIAGKQMKIDFLGLWDTVGAYGMPVEEFKPVVNFLFWPTLWDNLRLSPQVKRACHALSLDDERTTFHPIVFDERLEQEMILAREVEPSRLSQVWFAGVHANVGGGYPEDQLSLIPLDWVLSQAKAAGLVLVENTISSVLQNKSSYARLYDSRAGLAGYYRYTPRVIKTYDEKGMAPIWPVLHHSVLMRMMHGSDCYAPLPLTEKFHVLGLDGILYDSRNLEPNATARQGPGIAQTMDGNILFAATGSSNPTRRLEAALAVFAQPDARAMALAQDTVWWRRLAYFATMGFTLALASLPWSAPALASLAFRFQVFNAISQSASVVLGGVFKLLQSSLPDFTRAWTGAFVEYPLTFVALGGGLLWSFMLSQLLSGRIRGRNECTWHAESRLRYLAWLKAHARSVASNSGAVLIIALLILMWRWQHELESLLCGIAVALAAWSLSGAFNLGRQLNKTDDMPGTVSLAVARALRHSATLVAIYRWLSRAGVPMVIGILLVGAIIVVGNRALFTLASAMGHVCEASVPSAGKEHWVAIDQVCGATGVKLRAGHRYRITLSDPDGILFDRTTHTGLGGFEGVSLIHRTSKLLRRWWSENWLTPIARVGAQGNEEYALHPDEPYFSRPPADPEYQEKCNVAMTWCDARFEKPDADTLKAIAGKYPTPLDRRILTTTLAPQKDGELFLYVNDVTTFLFTGFYLNNSGAIHVQVIELDWAEKRSATGNP